MFYRSSGLEPGLSTFNSLNNYSPNKTRKFQTELSEIFHQFLLFSSTFNGFFFKKSFKQLIVSLSVNKENR